MLVEFVDGLVPNGWVLLAETVNQVMVGLGGVGVGVVEGISVSCQVFLDGQL